MRVKLIIATVVLLGSGASFADSARLKLDELMVVIDEHCPGAEIKREANAIQAKRNTMVFTIHRSSMTERWLPQTTEVEGPKSGGFMLALSFRTGKPGPSQATLSRSGWHHRRGPYFETWSGIVPTIDDLDHWSFRFSLSGLDSECRDALFKALPRRQEPSETPDDGEPQ